MKCELVIKDDLEFVEFDEHSFGLGLQTPLRKTVSSLSTPLSVPLLSMDEIKNIVQSEEFSFGREWFDEDYITNQNGHGSCASYGGASGLEKAIVLGGQPRTKLSGDYLYSLVNGGRDRGSMLDDNMEAIMNNGVCKRETVKLGEIYRSRYNKEEADAEAKRFRGHELFVISNEQEMATALCMKMPVVMAIHVTNNWRNFDAQDVLAAANGMGNHCEHLDDIRYNRKRGRLEYRKATSHGTSYSPGGATEGSGPGYCWTYWDGHYRRTINYHSFYAVPTAIMDPEADLPPWFQNPSPEPSPSAEPILEVVTQASCGGCIQWKKYEQPKLKEVGFEIKFVDPALIEGNLVPRFQLVVGDKVKPLKPLRYYKAEEIQSIASDLQGE